MTLTSNEWMQKAGELEAVVERRDDALQALNAQLDESEAEIERLQEELRLREASQIPVVPEAVQAEVERLKAEEDSAVEFVSRNRGISGFIADSDPSRSVNEWELFVRDLVAEVERLRAALKEMLAWFSDDVEDGLSGALGRARRALEGSDE